MDPQQPFYPPSQEPKAAPPAEPSFEAPQYNIVQSAPIVPAPKKLNKNLLLIILAVVLALGIGIGAGYMIWGQSKTNPKAAEQTTQTSSAGYTTFDDPNFTMQIPKDWTGDASYEPGQQMIFYYSPEDRNDENRQKAAYLTMYINSQANRIDQQLEGRDKTAKFTIISDETTEKDGVKRRIIEMVINSNKTPDDPYHLISTTVTYGSVTINTDITGPEEYWQELHAEDARTIIESITPKCSSPKISDQESYSSTILLCE